MEKELLIKCIDEGKTIERIKNETGKSCTTIRYWLKKYGLKTAYSSRELNTICICCSKPTKQGRRFCDLCCTNIARLRMRLSLIKYKGGKCSKCGYSDNISILEFHHIDPTKREFSITNVKSWKRMKEESDKCDLLCPNCHRKEHTANYWETLMKYVNEYKGDNKEFTKI